MKRLFLLSLLIGAALGCQGQVPATTYQVQLTWNAPSICTSSAPCTFQISRASIANGSCPAATGNAYVFIGTSASQATTYMDATAVSGASYCYIAQTTQAGATGDPSAPSNIVMIPSGASAPSGLGAVIQAR